MTWLRSNALALTLLVPLAACQTISPELLTQTTGRRGDMTDREITALVCDLFGPQSYDSRSDTPLTQDQIKEFNRKRTAYCAEKEKSR